MRFLIPFVFMVFGLFFTQNTYGQTLQFSQVLLVTTTQTVPANKVWKVESVFPLLNTSSSSSQSANIVLDGISISVAGGRSDYGMAFMPFPACLPAGTTLAAGANISKVSVLEFTVLP